jgi:hypothetical protein
MAALHPSLWNSSQYALLDCGAGRKLERFGGVVLDRPAPPARTAVRSTRVDWNAAAVRLDDQGRVVSGAAPEGRWQARFGSLAFNLALTPFGHVGLFPEQAVNWQWLTDLARVVGSDWRCSSDSPQPVCLYRGNNPGLGRRRSSRRARRCIGARREVGAEERGR